MSCLVYQAVIIGEDFTKESLEQMRESYSEQIVCLKPCRAAFLQEVVAYEECEDTVPSLLVDEGVLLEIRKQKDFLELHLLIEGHKIRYIHSKKVILTFYDKIEENQIISLYEVLWAAGVRLDAKTLLPMTNENQETSLEGLYYREEKRAG